MTRRRIGIVGVVAAAVLTWPVSTAQAGTEESAGSRPKLALIMADDMGKSLGAISLPAEGGSPTVESLKAYEMKSALNSVKGQARWPIKGHCSMDTERLTPIRRD